MNYMSIKEASALWGVSQQMIRRYCRDGRITGAIQKDGGWAVPVNANKPGQPAVIAPPKELKDFAKHVVYKGDSRTKEVFELLSARKNINFVGNMEARDVMSGDYDLVVADGFSGNVLLKSIEGTAKVILKTLKKEIMASTSAKFGALFMKKAIKGVMSTFDYHKHGGAVLLGCKKLLVKSHGSSNAESIVACINQVYTMSKGKLIEKIAKNLEKAGIADNE